MGGVVSWVFGIGVDSKDAVASDISEVKPEMSPSSALTQGQAVPLNRRVLIDNVKEEEISAAVGGGLVAVCLPNVLRLWMLEDLEAGCTNYKFPGACRVLACTTLPGPVAHLQTVVAVVLSLNKGGVLIIRVAIDREPGRERIESQSRRRLVVLSSSSAESDTLSEEADAEAPVDEVLSACVAGPRIIIGTSHSHRVVSYEMKISAVCLPVATARMPHSEYMPVRSIVHMADLGVLLVSGGLGCGEMVFVLEDTTLKVLLKKPLFHFFLAPAVGSLDVLVATVGSRGEDLLVLQVKANGNVCGLVEMRYMHRVVDCEEYNTAFAVTATSSGDMAATLWYDTGLLTWNLDDGKLISAVGAGYVGQIVAVETHRPLRDRTVERLVILGCRSEVSWFVELLNHPINSSP